MKKLSLVIIALALVSACSDNSVPKTEAIKTVDYFLHNQDEMIEKVSWCRESADRKITANCLNAISAEAKIGTAKLLGTDPLTGKLLPK
ncbi:EexN family lipoprotein [Shewanella sp. M16]|uniref:EexN family lipoprotein n=1 Tax=Shewanella sp. M16 TaxID=2830837 RepID=UPI001BAFF04D|nr:EexN family lipoprotein [Shewanella sp. M16]MBS0044842.1 EexN family lipoprotein [Shewanella sp. M16]